MQSVCLYCAIRDLFLFFQWILRQYLMYSRFEALSLFSRLAIPRPRVRQTAVFPSHTKQPNNQANQNQSINKSSQFHEPILLHFCCPGPQPAGEGSAAGLLLPVSGELLGVRSGMVGGKTTEESECGEERRPNGRGPGRLCLPQGCPTRPSDSYHTRNSFASPRGTDHLAIPRPRVRQTAVFPSHTKQPNNQANQNQSINKSSQFHEPIFLHFCCPGPQPAGEGSAAGLLLPKRPTPALVACGIGG